MNNLRKIAPLLLIASSSMVGQTKVRDDYLKEFETRARYITAPFDTASGAGYYQIAVKYDRGNYVAQADSMFEVLLKEPRGDMFWMFPVIGAYLHGKDKMSAHTKAIVRNAWKTYTPYRGDTENHWCMYYSSLFLAAEQWPGLPGSEWYNGKSSDENRDEAKAYLAQWMRITTTIGQGEFDSPDYFPEYAIPMLLLAQFAQDPEMRQRGRMMADYLFADFATEHLDGQYIGGFSRIYQPAVYKPLLSGASGFAYLYFATGQPTQSGWMVFPALSTYRLPQIICDVALDRAKPFVHKEQKRVRNVIRLGEVKNPPVYKYTYMTKDYGLSSLQGGILQPIQQHTWSVRYAFGRPYSTVFGLHPYWSSRELATFFPEEEKTMMSDVVASKGTYNNPDKWTGSSPFERTFQNKNTLIVLYDIEPGTTAEHIDGFFPMNLEERMVDASGWILCKAGETYIGWYPLQEYEWVEEYEKPGQLLNTIGRPEMRPEEKPQGNWRLRSHKLQNGYVVEVRSRAEINSFDDFRRRLVSHIPKATLVPGKVSVDYVTLEGNRMSFLFPDVRKLNGNQVDFKGYKLFDGPFLQAEVGSEKLTIRHNTMKRVLDFRSLKITE